MSTLTPDTQFRIPGGLGEQQPANLVDTPAVIEREPSPLEALKASEARIFGLREAALQQTPPEQKGWLRAATFRRPHVPTQQELINNESFCGGKIVHTNGSDRFWLDVQTEATKQAGIADWYFAQPTANAAAMNVIRFQTTNTDIHKLYMGRVVAFSDDERTAFLETVAAYEKAVTELYQPARIA